MLEVINALLVMALMILSCILAARNVHLRRKLDEREAAYADMSRDADCYRSRAARLTGEACALKADAASARSMLGQSRERDSCRMKHTANCLRSWSTEMAKYASGLANEASNLESQAHQIRQAGRDFEPTEQAGRPEAESGTTQAPA